MKKTLIASAVAAVVAAPAAFADVTISGQINQEFYDAGGDTQSDLNSDIVFSGKEDLGNGVTANWKIHTFMDNGTFGSNGAATSCTASQATTTVVNSTTHTASVTTVSTTVTNGYMREAVKVSHESPVLLDRFLNDALEVDVDAVSDGKDIVIGGIMEHIEQAGVHSGDSACSLPPYSLDKKTQDEIIVQTKQLAKALNVIGLMNVQFAIQGQDIYVLEVNPRASRTVPFVSKAIGRPLAKIAANCMAGATLDAQKFTKEVKPSFYSVKEAVFPFIKFPGVDTILGPEMKSTGEVMGVGHTFAEAFIKSQLAASMILPKGGKAFFKCAKRRPLSLY